MTTNPLTHAFHQRPDFPWPTCRLCGAIKPRFGEGGPCRGVVGLRDVEEESMPPKGWD